MNMKHNSVAPEEHIVTSIRLSKTDHQELKELAAREHRSVSQQVRYWIDRQVRTEAENAAAKRVPA
jgi:predicted DNA-binding ribbon-helix-helix protein